MKMKIRSIIYHILIIPILLSFCTHSAYAGADVVDSLVVRGDSLRMAYDFEGSVSLYKEALGAISDTSLTVEDSLLKIDISERLLLSENGKNMSSFVYSPKVVARHKFPLDEFFLYYPLRDSCWRPVPNQLDSISGLYARAMYVPEDSNTIYFSAPDNDGIRNIYATSHRDTLWSLPSLLNEEMTSASDEIYPVLSQDGKSLYFASRGLYGAGGYDLYVSNWDEALGDWGAPLNMGFPYSSPANDFLLAGSEDGKYMVFASDRDCKGDSVMVYVLEKEAVPVTRAVNDAAELRKLSMLEPVDGMHHDVGAKAHVKSEIPENVETKRYMDKASEVRDLTDSISALEQSMALLRTKYSESEDEKEKQSLAERILGEEAALPLLHGRLEATIKQLQDIEMDFLFSGVVIDPDKLLQEAEREVIGEDTGYVFSKKSFGDSLYLKMEVPEPEFDYSFKVLDEAQVLKDTVERKGIVYQIQIMSADRPAPLKALKGLSPVFEVVSSGGRYSYRVGLFHQYKDVLPHLNTVKRLGFRSAYIVAMIDGVQKSVDAVRTYEAKMKAASPQFYKVHITCNPDVDPAVLAGLKVEAGQKDIARTEDGFVVGPFEGEQAARDFMDFVDAMRYGQATIEQVAN